jgi:Protein of unknown function (DUF2934)
MTSNFEQKVRERAYELWVQDGGVEGCADHYWIRAERELLAQHMNALPAPETKAPAKARKAAAKPAEAVAPKKAPARSRAKADTTRLAS